jgi:hypothetical protein
MASPPVVFGLVLEILHIAKLLVQRRKSFVSLRLLQSNKLAFYLSVASSVV